MITEIELKFLVMDEDFTQNNSINNTRQSLTKILNLHKFNFVQTEKTINNDYFDTPTLNLRKNDIGLRVRESSLKTQSQSSTPSNVALEQTIKTSGKVIGGLHQRPEYNVSIESNIPDLTLFPQHIWSAEQNITDIQQQLQVIFSTNFTRSLWLITLDNNNEFDQATDEENTTVIELVFDQGVIKSLGESIEREETICEIELELVRGDVKKVLMLAEILSQHLQVRPGQKSKAARGYALWHQNVLAKTEQPKIIEQAHDEQSFIEAPLSAPLTSTLDISTAFNAGIEYGLLQLQACVESYIENPSFFTLKKLTDILAFLRQGFWLFKPYLLKEAQYIRDELSFFIKTLAWVENACHFRELMNKTGNYRSKVHYSDNLIKQLKLEKSRFPSENEINRLFYSPRFNLLQLLLLKIVLRQDRVIDLDVKASQYKHLTLTTLAELSLDHCLNQLFVAFPEEDELSSKVYIEQHKILIRCLLTGNWFGALYKSPERLKFRNSWLDIKQGISELQTLELLKQQLALVDNPSSQLERWLTQKIEHLLFTLHQSKEIANEIYPYWRND